MMNTQAHALTMMGIMMMIVMITLTSKVTPPVLTAHQVTKKRRGRRFIGFYGVRTEKYYRRSNYKL